MAIVIPLAEAFNDDLIDDTVNNPPSKGSYIATRK